MKENRLSHKLPMLSALPTSLDVRELQERALECIGQPIQMSWITDAKNSHYNLSCTISHGASEPEWSLSSGGIINRVVHLWKHTTGDTELILNLVLMESGAETAVEQNHKSMTLHSIPTLPPQEDSVQSVKNKHPYSTTGTHAAQPLTPSSEKSTVSDTLQGSLMDMPLASVLQSISMTKMTGRLSVEQDVETANIYFEEGVPVHATSLEAEGDFALLEMVSWDTGRFIFFSAERTTSRTVKKRLETALIEGAALSDQQKYLTRIGLQPNTYLLKTNSSITESEFERTLAEASVTDMRIIKRLYIYINGCTLSELLIGTSVRKAEWVPAIYNLLNNKLIKLKDKPSLESIDSTLELVDLDVSMVAKAHDAILQPETKALSYPLFMYFLQQEHFRFQRSGLPYALIIFEFCVTKGGISQVPNPFVQKTILNVIGSLIRRTDLVGHFRTFEFGLLLPYTNTHGAIVIAKKLLANILDTDVEDSSARSLYASMGIASLPADVRSLDLLVAAALDAKKMARKTGQPIVPFNSAYSQPD